MGAQGGYEEKSYYKQVISELEEIYRTKNHDYGDSFAIMIRKFGLKSTVMRLWDKLMRLETLCDKEQKLMDESIEDTLKDIANYAIMTVAEMRKREAAK